MRDFNFFRSYQKHKTGKAVAFVRYGIAAFAVLVLIGAISGFNLYRIYSIKHHMAEMETFMTNPEHIKQYKKYLEENDKLAILTSYYDSVNKINRVIEGQSRINTETVDLLLTTMPEDIMLDSMSLNKGQMDFQGVSKSYTAIAEFEYNLRTSGLFSQVFVSNITTNEFALSSSVSELYSFAVSCKVKEEIEK